MENTKYVRGIYWSTEDFRGMAEQKWEDYLFKYPTATCWQDVYNENKFHYALDRMIDKHNATIGISWDTIDFY